jgi:hypothetical protein
MFEEYLYILNLVIGIIFWTISISLSLIIIIILLICSIIFFIYEYLIKFFNSDKNITNNTIR